MGKIVLDKTDYDRSPPEIDPKKVRDYRVGGTDGPMNNMTRMSKNFYGQVAKWHGDRHQPAQILSVSREQPNLIDRAQKFVYDWWTGNAATPPPILYKCRMIQTPACYGIPEPANRHDNIIHRTKQISFILPHDSEVDSTVLAPGVTVLVNLSNPATMFVSEVAGTIIKVLDENTTIEGYSSNCEISKAKIKSKKEARSYLLGECNAAFGGKGKRRRVPRAPTKPMKTTDGKFPKSPITGLRQKSTTVFDSDRTAQFVSPRKDGYGYPTRTRNGVLEDHKGVDMRTLKNGVPSVGVPIKACLDGVVMWGQASGDPKTDGYGYYIVVKHTEYLTSTTDNTFYTLYAHLKSNRPIGPGAKVKAGTVIGYSGKSGAASRPGSGPHLHFEVIYQHDPTWMTGNDVTRGGSIDPIEEFFMTKFVKKRS